MSKTRHEPAACLVALLAALALGGCAEEADPEVAHDTGVASASEPEEFAGGFVDLTATLASPPFTIDVGDVAAEREPEVTFGVFADLDGGASLEVIVSGAVREEGGHQIYSYDRATGSLSPWDNDPLPSGAVSIAEDLDGDGHVDLVMTHGQGMSVRWGDAQRQFAEATSLAGGQYAGAPEGWGA